MCECYHIPVADDALPCIIFMLDLQLHSFYIVFQSRTRSNDLFFKVKWHERRQGNPFYVIHQSGRAYGEKPILSFNATAILATPTDIIPRQGKIFSYAARANAAF
jgi:hypothetical protein